MFRRELVECPLLFDVAFPSVVVQNHHRSWIQARPEDLCRGDLWSGVVEIE
jgi:hypothetical protein